MASTFTTLLRLNKPSLGDAGWGTAVNGGFTDLADSAIAGTTTLNTDADVTLTTANGAADQSRQMILNCTGSRAAQRTITAPAASKVYVVINGTTGGFGVKIVGVGPTTGVVVPNGRMAVVAWNGSDFVTLGAVVDLTATGNVTVAGATTLAALTASGNVSFDGGTFVFNESGADKDARFEGDTDANLLFLDASTDQVGIGTATPTAKLQVSGGSIRLSDGQQIEWGGGFNSIEGSNASNYLRFWTNNTERMRLDSSGNLGLGVTPSAWDIVFKAIQAGSGAAFVGSNLTSQSLMLANAYTDAGGLKYINTAQASYYQQYLGAHTWFTAPSGTAGNAISFTQAMTLDGSGNLGLGTVTSPGYLIDATAPSSGDTTLRLTKNGSVNTTINAVTNALTFGIDGSGGATERARITSSGALLLGTTDGNLSSGVGYKFAVGGSWGVVINQASTYNSFHYYNENAINNGYRFYVQADGGVANYSGNNVNLSDARVKTDIKPAPSYWNLIKAIEIVTFKYKDQDHSGNTIGVIAQQVERVAPELVDNRGFGETPEDGTPLKAVFSNDMYHAAIGALQEAMRRIETLEAKVAALEVK